MHILIIEDERKLASVIQRVLSEEHHTAEIALDGPTGLALALANRYDVIILDVMLPGLDGMQVCRELRTARVATPILMLTARGEVEDRVEGLNAGADDYLVKPFAMAELLARVAALGRRVRGGDPASVLQVGDLTLDVQRHEARRGDRIIDLTAKEFALLELLMRHPGQVLSRAQILDNVWRYDAENVSNVVDIYIHYLRDKIDRGFAHPLIKTVRGFGYRIQA